MEATGKEEVIYLIHETSTYEHETSKALAGQNIVAKTVFM